MMSRRFIGGVALLLALAVVATVVFGAFQLGVAQGTNAGAAETARHYGGWGPYGGGFAAGFIFFKLLFGLLFLFLIFGLLRAAFGGPRWGPGPWGGRSWAGEHGGPQDAFEQWHRRAHERSDSAPSPNAPGGTSDTPGGTQGT